MSNNTATIDKPLSREKRRQLAREEKAQAAAAQAAAAQAAAVGNREDTKMNDEWSTVPESTTAQVPVAESTTAQVPATEVPIKRGPGRPKGSGKKQTSTTTTSTTPTSERKKPGPPKGYRRDLNTPATTTVKRKPGRPPNAARTTAAKPAIISAPITLIITAMYPSVSPEKITAIVYLLEN